MTSPDRPSDEAARLEALLALDVLDTPVEDRFDRITRLAQRLFSVDVARIGFVDSERTWFKSRYGFPTAEIPREMSFDAHALTSEGVFLVPDATADERFAQHPAVLATPHIRFYAAVPLRLAEGSAVGMLSIAHGEARDLDEHDRALLLDLGGMVVDELRVTEKQVTADPITGLTNRPTFLALLDKTMHAARRHGPDLALLYIELLNHADVRNDHGREVGQDQLRHFAWALKGAYRRSDVVARIGGAQFAVLLVAAGDGLDQCVATLESQIEILNARDDDSPPILHRAGVVRFDPETHRRPADFISAAEAAAAANSGER